MPHPLEHGPAHRTLTTAEAEALAESVRAFGAGSRLRLLWALLDGERTVEELAEATELGSSAASHQLRLLRQGRLVAVRREGATPTTGSTTITSPSCSVPYGTTTSTSARRRR